MALKKAALTETQTKILAEALSAKQYPAHIQVVHVPGASEPFAWLICNHPKMALPAVPGH